MYLLEYRVRERKLNVPANQRLASLDSGRSANQMTDLNDSVLTITALLSSRIQTVSARTVYAKISLVCVPAVVHSFLR